MSEERQQTEASRKTPEADTQTESKRAREARLMRFATYASVGVASCLIGVKLLAWLWTDSVSMLSTLMDSVLDAAASLLNLFAVRQALQPADKEHRFGHGKAEALSALAQATFIAGSGLFLAIEASRRLLDPQPVAEGGLGIIVMLLSIGLTILLVLYQNYVRRQTKSLAIDADSLHYKGDLLVNVGVICALVLSSNLVFEAKSLWYADPVIGLLIAVYILYNAWSILRASYDELMDRELSDGDRQKIVALAFEHPDVLALHDLRTRSSGREIFIQLHLEMDPELSLLRAHAVADAVEYQLRKAFPGADIIVHQDPYHDPIAKELGERYQREI